MKFDALVLIDCWEEDTWDTTVRKEKATAFHKRLAKFVAKHEFKQVIFATANYKARPTSSWLVRNITNSSKGLLPKTQIENFYEFYRTGIKPRDKLLVGGAAWNLCVHGNQIGLMNLMNEEHFSILTHPEVVDSYIDDRLPVTIETILSDNRIRWNSANPEGFMVASYVINRRK